MGLIGAMDGTIVRGADSLPCMYLTHTHTHGPTIELSLPTHGFLANTVEFVLRKGAFYAFATEQTKRCRIVCLPAAETPSFFGSALPHPCSLVFAKNNVLMRNRQ